MRPLSVLPLDGSPDSLDDLVGALTAAMDGSGPAVLPLGAADHRRGASAPPADEVPDEVAVVISTSGSTGRPKHVMLSAAALTASARATEERLGGPGRWVLALPVDHVAGVQVVLRALAAGAPPVLQDVRDGFRPAGFARATGRLPHGARRYTSLVPTQLGRILDEGAAAMYALAGYDAVLVGGAALAPALRERAEAAGIRVVATYGMSETCGGCVYDGLPLAGVDARVDAAGRLSLGGPVLASGYLGDPAATAASFVGGRFVTGDLGRWDGERLVVLGRADDVIVTGGEKVAPAAVERVLAAQAGVAAVCVVGLPDPEWGQVVAAAIVPSGAGPDLEAVRAAVRAAEGRAAVPRRMQLVAELPLRGVGKPDRTAVAALLDRVGDPPTR
ncbi:o-succinylbenzoate--CoA ligase [Pseudonocardia sp. WMMC193]|uniref:o-succinylbenzoate--CoA ligase n=1 Tax=Pseudonocardia sp. WMMC193 TaxID=2911965 RepID=UPI001F1B9909|nr:o-succinylbenzoate--CoA ligase [Pseudonocardia sp. WMMC193]MCF7552956.1 o-succinylbenzoate--CoA ligase [Pseudonocardia sp. WMMC193]